MSSSFAFDGFFVITGILVISWFLLIMQLYYVWTFDGQWEKILNKQEVFPTVSQRKRNTDPIYDPEGFFVGRSLSLGNFTKMHSCLHRKSLKYNDSIIGVDATIVLGGLILWIPMLVFLMRKKLPTLYSFWRGIYLILTGFFFVITGLASLVLCCLLFGKGSNRHDSMLVNCLKVTTEYVDSFYNTTSGASGSTDFDRWDNINPEGDVVLSPPTWFLLIMTCLRGSDKNVFKLIHANKIGKNSIHIRELLEIAIERLTGYKTFTVIYKQPYSFWFLQSLNLCPKEPVDPIIQGFLAVILLFLGPCVCFFLWCKYGKKNGQVSHNQGLAIMSFTDMHRLSVLRSLTPESSRVLKNHSAHKVPEATTNKT